MGRRELLALFPGLLLRAAGAPEHRIGRLDRTGAPVLIVDGQPVKLKSDKDTELVLRDKRVPAERFEVLGRAVPPDAFQINGIHTRSLFVHQNGKRLMVTYWCDVCYIRTYSPGNCWCCQKDTDLDLREESAS